LDLVDGQIVHRESNNDVMNPLFSEVGYRYTNSVLRNTGLIGIFAIAIFFFVLFVDLTVPYWGHFKWAKKLLAFVWYKIFWNIPIRYAMTTYLGFSMATFIAFYGRNDALNKTVIDKIKLRALIVGLVLVPAWMTFILLKHWGLLEFMGIGDKTKHKKFWKKYNTMFYNVSIWKESSLFVHLVFCVRRFFYAVVVTYLSKWPQF
jgi:hypothetical protein